MSHDDFDFETCRGIPAPLPEGEKLLWQGSPEWLSLAVRAYHIRKVAGYFALLILWRIGFGISAGHSVAAIGLSCLVLTGLGIAGIGVLSLLAYLNARSTVYSITTRRILLRHGVAVPLTMNLPLKLIDNAGVKEYSNGTGDITLNMPRADRIGYLITWPHLRPGRIAHPEPSLRGLADAQAAATVLRNALGANLP